MQPDDMVQDLSRTIHEGGFKLDLVPKILKVVIRKDYWKERYVNSLKRTVSFDRFEAFVTTLPPEGLGTKIEDIKRLCHGDLEAEDLLDRVTVGPPGVHAGVDNVNTRPDGNSRQYSLRKLRRDRPDLHKQVVAGKKTANAAMIEAGFRKRPTVLDQLKKLWNKATLDERLAFTTWLDEQ